MKYPTVEKILAAKQQKVKFYDIEWEADNMKDVKHLPKTVELLVDSDVDIDSEGADILSDKFGFTLNGFNYKIL